jgi:hypothetical protein
MANTYTWTAETLQDYPTYQGQVRCVFRIYYTCTGTDGVNTAKYGAWCTIAYDDTNNYNYIPYENLTNDICMEWVKSAIGDKMQILSQAVDKKLMQLSNPPTEQTPPWISN